MPRRARATTEEVAPLAQQAPQQPTAQEPPAEPDVFDQAIAAQQAEIPPATEQSEDADHKKKWVDQGPRGIASIDLGDGRKIHLLRNNSMQQVGIRFTAEENVDPKPAREDIDFLKDNGFRWRGGDEKMWTRQFATPEDKERLAAIEAEQGAEQAKLERSRIRVRAMQEAERVFAELGNAIRQRNGNEPVSLSFGQDQGRRV